MKQYLDMLQTVLENGSVREDRTGVGVVGCFAPGQMVFDLQEGFPLLTTKKMFLRGIVEELLWFLRGSTDVRELQERNVHIWDGNYNDRVAHGHADDGDLGPIYGKQWRCVENYDTDTKKINRIDQISTLIQTIKSNPMSRRLVVSAWNVAELDYMALPPCHCLFQCYVRDGKYLDLQMYQRSADMFLGVPFNIASYALLDMMIAQQTGLKPGRFTHTLGDAHIYCNHVSQVREQLRREPRALPTMQLVPAPAIDMYELGNFHLNGYEPWDAIKGEMAV